MPLVQRVCSEKIGVGAEVSPVAIVNSCKVSLQKDGEASQRATFFHFPTPASLFFFSSHSSLQKTWVPAPMWRWCPKADLLFVGLVWTGFPLGGMAER